MRAHRPVTRPSFGVFGVSSTMIPVEPCVVRHPPCLCCANFKCVSVRLNGQFAGARRHLCWLFLLRLVWNRFDGCRAYLRRCVWLPSRCPLSGREARPMTDLATEISPSPHLRDHLASRCRQDHAHREEAAAVRRARSQASAGRSEGAGASAGRVPLWTGWTVGGASAGISVSSAVIDPSRTTGPHL